MKAHLVVLALFFSNSAGAEAPTLREKLSIGAYWLLTKKAELSYRAIGLFNEEAANIGQRMAESNARLEQRYAQAVNADLGERTRAPSPSQGSKQSSKAGLGERPN